MGKAPEEKTMTINSSLSLRAIVASAILLGAGGLASAQEESDSVLEEVLVTASKRTESLQDLPFSVSALGEQLITDSQLATPQDLAQLTPGLKFIETIGRNTGTPVIRGVSPVAFQDPTVLIYTDGFTLGLTGESNNSYLFDLERIEVLKGPQATLYGRNALGGVINYITKKPGNEFEGWARAEYGDISGGSSVFDAGVSFGGPIVEDKFFVKIAAGYREDGGFLDNLYDGSRNINDTKDQSAGAILRATPSDRLEMTLTITYNESNDECGDCSNVPQPWGTGTFEDYLLLGQGTPDINDAERNVNQDNPGFFDREEIKYVFNFSYDFDGVNLTNIFGYGDLDTRQNADLDRLPGPTVPAGFVAFDNNISQTGWSNELRLSSTGDGAFRWMLGLYYFDLDRDQTILVESLFGTFPTEISNREIQNSAIFVNADYDFTERFNVGFGLRYDKEDTSIQDFIGGTIREGDGSEWLPKLTARYRANEDLTVYGTISRGYHAGGLNSDTAPSPTYEPEFLWNYEIGIKGFTPSGRMRYELAAFYMDWTDQQLETFFFNGFFNEAYVVNVGKSRIYGLDGSFSAELSDGFTLGGGFSWLDAEYKEYFDFQTAPGLGLNPDLSGNTLINTPEFTATLNAQYIRPIGSGAWDMRLRFDGTYNDEFAVDVTNVGIVDSYFLANAYIGVQNENFEVGLFARNLFDEEYLTGGFIPGFNPFLAFPPLASIGRPRTIGVRVRYSF